MDDRHEQREHHRGDHRPRGSSRSSGGRHGPGWRCRSAAGMSDGGVGGRMGTDGEGDEARSKALLPSVPVKGTLQRPQRNPPKQAEELAARRQPLQLVPYRERVLGGRRAGSHEAMGTQDWGRRGRSLEPGLRRVRPVARSCGLNTPSSRFVPQSPAGIATAGSSVGFGGVLSRHGARQIRGDTAAGSS